jgi:hypothetical protein
MTKRHEYEVNLTYSGSLTPFEFYFRQELAIKCKISSKNKKIQNV